MKCSVSKGRKLFISLATASFSYRTLFHEVIYHNIMDEQRYSQNHNIVTHQESRHIFFIVIPTILLGTNLKQTYLNGAEDDTGITRQREQQPLKH
jgi:hypothetical protein